MVEELLLLLPSNHLACLLHLAQQRAFAGVTNLQWCTVHQSRASISRVGASTASALFSCLTPVRRQVQWQA